MWSLIIAICMATPEGAACVEGRRLMIETRAECLSMRNTHRREIVGRLDEAGVEPLYVTARCERGLFS